MMTKRLISNDVGGGHDVSATLLDFAVWTFGSFSCPVFSTTSNRPERIDRVALRIYEWTEMRNIVKTINNDYPALGTALPCYRQDDHNNQLSAFQCLECYTFGADARPD